MANATITAEQSGDYVVTCEQTASVQGGKAFILAMGGSGEILRVGDDAKITLHGPLVSEATFEILNSTEASDTVASFQSSGTEVATIGVVGDFSTGGLRLAVVTTKPDGSLSGYIDRILVYDDGAGNFYLCLKTPDTGTSWLQIALS